MGASAVFPREECMNTKLLSIPTLLLAAAVAGCSLAPYRQSTDETGPSPAEIAKIQNGDPVKEKIYLQHRQWKGTRYVLGGLSKRGVDCSGLVYTTYRDHFGIELPRTTRYQARAGKAVEHSELRAGDLVFFRTGHKVRHVGIYIEDNRFFHASTSKGVTISELDDYYWRDRYRHARRVALDARRIPLEK